LKKPIFIENFNQQKSGGIKIIKLVDNMLTRPLKNFSEEWGNKKKKGG